MIDKQELLVRVVALNFGPTTHLKSFSAVQNNYVIILDKNGDLTSDGDGLRDGVHIFRDTFCMWGMSFRPAKRYGPSMRYENPVELVKAALAREHGPHALYLSPAEVRHLRGR